MLNGLKMDVTKPSRLSCYCCIAYSLLKDVLNHTSSPISYQNYKEIPILYTMSDHRSTGHYTIFKAGCGIYSIDK